MWDGGVGDFGVLWEELAELGGEVAGEFVLEDDAANGDAPDLFFFSSREL